MISKAWIKPTQNSNQFLWLYPNMRLLLLVCLRRRSHSLPCSAFSIQHQRSMHTCVYLHRIVLQNMRGMQAALWGQFIWREADMRNVLDYKCDQEHAKMQFIDHQYQFIFAHLDGLLSNQLQIISNLENHLYTSSVKWTWVHTKSLKVEILGKLTASFDPNLDPVSLIWRAAEFCLELSFGQRRSSIVCEVWVHPDLNLEWDLRLHKHTHLSVIWALELKEQKHWYIITTLLNNNAAEQPTLHTQYNVWA